jgi:hypothetical protein
LASSLSALALEAVDYLRTPASRTTPNEGRRFAMNGALIVIYLLDVAARQKQLSDASARRPGKDVFPAGLSLLGLAAVAISGRLAAPSR